MPLNLYNPNNLNWDVIPYVANNRFTAIKRPDAHSRMLAWASGVSGLSRLGGYVETPSYWPWFGAEAKRHRLPDGADRGYWQGSDATFFDGLSDDALTALNPLYAFMSAWEKETYRNLWKDVLATEEVYLNSKEFATKVIPGGIQFQDLATRVRRVFDAECLYTPATLNIENPNPQLMNYLVPFWEHYAGHAQKRILSEFKNWFEYARSPGPDLHLLGLTRVAVYKSISKFFPWNDITCRAFFPGYDDLSAELKTKYQTMRYNCASLFLNINLDYRGDYNTVGFQEYEIALFEYQNSPSYRALHKQISDYWLAWGTLDVARFNASFKQGYQDFLNSDFLPGINISTEDFLKGYSIAVKGIAIAGAVAFTAITAGALAPAISSAASGIVPGVTVSETVATAAVGAAATGGAEAVTGGNVLSGVDSKLLPSVNLGVDTNLTGDKKMFEFLQTFGDDTLRSLSNVSLSDAGTALSDVTKNLSPSNFSIAGAWDFTKQAIGGITLGDVAKAATPTPSTQTAQQSANQTNAVNAVVKSVSENKVPIAVILGLGIVAYFAMKGKF